MSDLKFTREDNEKYNTINIKIENAIIQIKEGDYKITNTEKSKYDYKRATIKIENDDLINKLKS